MQVVMAATYLQDYQLDLPVPVAFYEHHKFPCNIPACQIIDGIAPATGFKTKCNPNRGLSLLDSDFCNTLQSVLKRDKKDFGAYMTCALKAALDEWKEENGEFLVEDKIVQEHIENFGLALCIISKVKRATDPPLQQPPQQMKQQREEDDSDFGTYYEALTTE